jgi:hypothetical protein
VKKRRYLAKDRGCFYIGLRQSPEQAVVRAVEVEGADYHKLEEEAKLLKIMFTPFGVSHFTMLFEQNYQFRPRLHKVLNKVDTGDKGIWHFIGDLPLSLSDRLGNELVKTRWVDMRRQGVGEGRRR